ncbi:MAG: hypothetical protein PHG00_05995 [Methylococcales bacterium]|nr:hypothetical protein [Methylococcales bacterium]
MQSDCCTPVDDGEEELRLTARRRFEALLAELGSVEIEFVTG